MMGTRENKRQPVELADIIREYSPSLKANRKLCPEQHKAIDDMTACRTSELKGHLSVCDNCGHREQSYNSCRNRHCNKCQYMKQTIWVENLKGRLLPGKYFHLVFTLPACLNRLIYRNQQVCYSLLFQKAWSALQSLCANPRFLGAQPGAVAVLHTWSSTLVYHPHVHMLVPAGGLSDDGMEWIRPKKNFLVPVKVLSKIFRARFCESLLNLLQTGSLDVPKEFNTEGLKQKLYAKDWVVYAKKTGKTADRALEYLGRYTHRVAISNQRIESFEQGTVRFRYKDSKTGHYNREMTLDGETFVKRFLLHVLPTGFYKIRYFGVLASANATAKKEQCLALIGKGQYLSPVEGLNAYEAFRILTGVNPWLCKQCRKGILKAYPINDSA
ncbi:IS91 family transposase [Gaoshiqia sediminis]|uniref:IS91 family transposase n=1 Tax=Gaoshiqia sediminis TaxID=2986998 RepID=A0AA42CBH3_9BACT|nr:IS91 family transposase [Gaoshiqia sediminis]MCW0485030.1 IS91 family transposase [Gaoshiqia sediminis]